MELSEWSGSRPQRFHGGRKHQGPTGQLTNSLQPKPTTLSNCGIRVFQRRMTQQSGYKPHQKIFPNTYISSGLQIDLRGKKYLGISQKREMKRAERKHVPGNFQTIDEVVLRGVKPFEHHNRSSKNQYCTQQKLQKKTRVPDLNTQRNQFSVRTLGQKPYKYPEYSTNFYKQSGLIVGSTNKPRAQSNLTDKKIGSILTKPNWNQKVKMQEAQEDQKAVNSVDDWEQTTLKEANPNWNDPDTFFERLQAAKNQGKQIKKAGKK